jgi:hypothetical protein
VKDEMARRLSVKHEQLLKDLSADLALGDAQLVEGSSRMVMSAPS